MFLGKGVKAVSLLGNHQGKCLMKRRGSGYVGVGGIRCRRSGMVRKEEVDAYTCDTLSSRKSGEKGLFLERQGKECGVKKTILHSQWETLHEGRRLGDGDR